MIWFMYNSPSNKLNKFFRVKELFLQVLIFEWLHVQQVSPESVLNRRNIYLFIYLFIYYNLMADIQNNKQQKNKQ